MADPTPAAMAVNFAMQLESLKYNASHGSKPASLPSADELVGDAETILAFLVKPPDNPA